MPGSGVNSDNIIEFKKIKSKEVHGSFLSNLKNKDSHTDLKKVITIKSILKQTKT